MPASKYQPLLAALAALPAEQPSLTLTFTELERLVGPLSESARVTTDLWSRLLRGHGFTAQLDRRAQRVTFTRTSPDTGTLVSG